MQIRPHCVGPVSYFWWSPLEKNRKTGEKEEKARSTKAENTTSGMKDTQIQSQDISRHKTTWFDEVLALRFPVLADLRFFVEPTSWVGRSVGEASSPRRPAQWKWFLGWKEQRGWGNMLFWWERIMEKDHVGCKFEVANSF